MNILPLYFEAPAQNFNIANSSNIEVVRAGFLRVREGE